MIATSGPPAAPAAGPATGGDGSPALAGRGRRLAAAALDLMLVALLTLLLVMTFDVVEDAEDYVSAAWIGWVLLLAVMAYLLLNGYLLWRRGQTVGKALMGIRLATGAGGRPPLWRLLGVRALFFPLPYLLVVWPLSLLPIADLLAIFTRRRRCLHDLIAGTQVVDAPGHGREPAPGIVPAEHAPPGR